MLATNDIKEELSYAYLHAIAAHGGFRCCRPSPDRDSVDVEIQARGQLRADSILHGPELKVQLKATAVKEMPTTDFTYQLRLKNYDDLRQRCMSPRLLMVFIMPIEQDEWATIADDHLVTRRCMFWCNLLNKPLVPFHPDSTDPKVPVTIKIANKVNTGTIRRFLEIVSCQEDIGE